MSDILLPRVILELLAAHVPVDLRPHLVLVGSLAAALRFDRELGGRGVATKVVHVIPAGSLIRIPLHAVPLSDGHPFGERLCVVQHPSLASLLTTLGHSREPSAADVVALLDPEGNLPAARNEQRTISACFPASEIRVGAEATATSLRGRSKPTVLHLACHGEFFEEMPLFSHLRLAPAPGSDGRFTLADALLSGAPASVALLHGCSTGRASHPGASEWISLAEAWLAGGARAVVSALWPLDDTAASVFSGALLKELAIGSPLGGAFAAAVRTLRLQLPSPFYWAPYVLMGDSRLSLAISPAT